MDNSIDVRAFIQRVCDTFALKKKQAAYIIQLHLFHSTTVYQLWIKYFNTLLNHHYRYLSSKIRDIPIIILTGKNIWCWLFSKLLKIFTEISGIISDSHSKEKPVGAFLIGVYLWIQAKKTIKFFSDGKLLNFP